VYDLEDREAGRASGPIALDGPGLVTPSITEDASIPLLASFLADRRAERWAGGEPLRPDASVSGTVNRFSPRDVPADVWRRVEPTVKEAVTKAAPGDPQKANHQLSIVTQLAVWADRIGQPIEAKSLFHPEFLDRFITEGCAHLSHGTQLNYRTNLWRVGEAVLGGALFPPRALPLQRSSVASPYSAAAVTELVSWSRGLPTAHMRRNCRALLAIGLGAGLTSQEITSLVGTDIRVEGGVVLVEVGGKLARSVPVLATWADEVAELADDSGPRPFYMPDRTRITRRDILGFIERCSSEGVPKFNVQRLRITWVVGHLASGIPLSALVPASGVGVAQLGKYLRFVAPVSEGEYRRRLSGAV
jgi:hypothetical protein